MNIRKTVNIYIYVYNNLECYLRMNEFNLEIKYKIIDGELEYKF
jgi:hypothetical protein